MSNSYDVIIAGAGISGASLASLIGRSLDTLILEKDDGPGGLIKCKRFDGHLFHLTGGHVFNSKNSKVVEWFWEQFQASDFALHERNAVVGLNGQVIPYPIENNIFRLPQDLSKRIYKEVLTMNNSRNSSFPSTPGSASFEEFLAQTFGQTLYELYFKPYNEKIWMMSLSEIPISWLEGKLPMPSPQDIILVNLCREKENGMVHSSFYYPTNNGSQHLIDTLLASCGARLSCNSPLESIRIKKSSLFVNDTYSANMLVYTGDARKLLDIIKDPPADLANILTRLTTLKSNGTTNILCTTEPVPYSWEYLPSKSVRPHRIIYTGNFSKLNNGNNEDLSCVVEISGYLDKSLAVQQAIALPRIKKTIRYNYTPNSYVIQEPSTRAMISAAKAALSEYNIFLLGRFAEWEYYNMDKCIESAMALAEIIGKFPISKA